VPEHNLIQACVDEIREVEPAGVDRQMTRDDVPALLATPGFASDLVASAACTAAPDWRDKLALFKFLVERALGFRQRLPPRREVPERGLRGA